MMSIRPFRSAGRLAVAALAVAGLSASTLVPGSGDTGDATTVTTASAAPAPVAAPSVPVPVPQESSSPAGDEAGPDETVLGPAAVEAIGDDLGEVAALNELTDEELTERLQDPTYGVGPDGRLFVAEFLDEEHTADQAEVGGAGGDEPVALAAVVPLDQTFGLSSLPGSRRTIYLDFDGHTLTNTIWNQVQGIPNGRTVPPFSLDGSDAFSAAELEYIQNVWLAVSEDYAPFDVNVTTRAPSTDQLRRSTSDDQTYGARAIITTPRVQADFPSSCPITSTCAGLAYVDVFDTAGPSHARYEGAFVNAAAVGSPLALTTIVSHEVGHNGGLNHAGFTDGVVTRDYYSGTGNWGPIMGTPYSRPLSQWTNHSYPGHTNEAAADLTVLASHGIAPRPDDAGSTIGSSTPSGWTTSRRGLISTPTDQDVWNIGRCDGTITVSATPSAYSTNLDLALTLVTGTSAAPVEGARVDPPSGQSGSGSSMRATGVAATVQRSAGDTQYYVRVAGSPTGPDTGYGNLGPYTLSATCAGFSQQPAGLPRFTDVPPGQSFFGQIEWLAGSGVSTGYDQGNGTTTFQPSAAVLREQMAAFLYRFAGATASSTSCGLLDVPSSSTFAKEICWLKGTSITTGYAVPGGTQFRGAQPVLREQMAAFLYRFAGEPPSSTSCELLDVPPSSTFAKEICWLKSTGITTGYAVPGGTQFRGSQPVLREQMAAFLSRYDDQGLPVAPAP
ncbi:S-layer homology domain-containing protein [Aeromicrobium sp. Sec7.5]|uniref:S-layer homology domain-containing protein n=1 Tax=Aeromicrobium sp. Sec7.5 TaxID=3121276 RepID=UPI002FE476F8